MEKTQRTREYCVWAIIGKVLEKKERMINTQAERV